jgi:peptide/nickel transport system substrate-binding protein
MSFIYDTLLWKDGSGTLLPWLAERHEAAPDGRTHTFLIREGVTWHDGQPLTADDVAFTFEYFLSRDISPQVFVRPYGVSAVRTEGDRAVVVELQAPFVTFVSSVAGALPIVPKHVWSSVADPSAVSDPEVLVGSGPYRLESYARGEGSYLYTANDRFFLGPPFVRRIEMPPVADELAALLAGEIDAGGPNPIAGARPEALDPFRNDPAFGILEGPNDFTLALYWNLGRGGALADVRFRRACCHAIDRKDIVDRLLGGNGLPGNPGFLPPTHPFYARVEQYPFDPDRAERILDEAGYLKGAGGIRRDPEGRPLRFNLLVANDPVPPVTDIIVASLKPLGVELVPEAVDRVTHDTRTTAGDYEMAVTSFGGLGGDPDYMRRVYASGQPKAFQSAQGYTDPEFDELASRQLVTVDEAERRELVRRMQEIVARDVPLLPLYYPTFFHIFRRAVFDQWYFTPGGFAGGIPTAYNKHAFVTGNRTGLEIRSVE